MRPAPPDPVPRPPTLPPAAADRILAFVERTPDLVGVTDDQGGVTYLNDAARRLLGIPPGAPDPRTTAEIFTEEAFERYFDEVRPAVLRGDSWSGLIKVRTATGRTVDVWASVVGEAQPGGEVTSLVMVGRDVTEWLEVQAELSRRATHDELTGLVGRSVLFERIDLALHRTRRNRDFAAVLFIDVNDLKAVNDRLGHRAGDDLLVEVARRLQRTVRTVDLVARVGGDEFVVLLDGVKAEADAGMLATRIRAAVESTPVRADHGEVNVSVSIGVAVTGGDGPEADTDALIQRADAAMYAVKRDRKRAGAAGRTGGDLGRTAVHDIAVAVTQRAVRPWFQPVASVRTGGTEGYQALARWIRPGGEVVAAGTFIPRIGTAGVGFSVDLTVLREAARAVAPLTGPTDARLWSHVSPRFLATPGADHFIAEVLDFAGIAPTRLTLAVPGDLAVDPVGEAVARVADLGVRLAVAVPDPAVLAAIDGARVARHVGEVRLGCAFVRELAEHPHVVGEVVRRAHGDGREVQLLGIETAEDLDRAVAAGVDRVAGFHLGAPAPEPDAAGPRLPVGRRAPR